MARPLASISTTTTTNIQSVTSTNDPQISALIDEWKVQYARFISYSSCTFNTTHPSLAPVHKSRLAGGTWISTSDAACLKLHYHRKPSGLDDAVLVLSVRSRVLEEHYISKMHFSWPQVSCVAGFPPRGSKAVFVNYKNSVGQIQKFALRFLTSDEAEKFMNFLKEILGRKTPLQIEWSDFNSELSSQAEIIPSSEPPYQIEGDSACATSVDNSTQLLLPSCELNATDYSVSRERTVDYEPAMMMSEFPPRFTDLLKSCDPVVDKAKPTEPEGDLKTQFMRYLEGTSFKELLATVEDVVSELGDDLVF